MFFFGARKANEAREQRRQQGAAQILRRPLLCTLGIKSHRETHFVTRQPAFDLKRSMDVDN